MAAVTLPIVTTYNDKGVKGAQFSLKGLVTSQLGAAVSAGALVQQLGKAVTAFNEDEKAQQLIQGLEDSIHRVQRCIPPCDSTRRNTPNNPEIGSNIWVFRLSIVP